MWHHTTSKIFDFIGVEANGRKVNLESTSISLAKALVLVLFCILPKPCRRTLIRGFLYKMNDLSKAALAFSSALEKFSDKYEVSPKKCNIEEHLFKSILEFQ